MHFFRSCSAQEIIQNADDARATEVKFYLDCRNLSTLPHELVRSGVHSELDRFQGPALMCYNNAQFREEDWESIQNLQQSGKAKNPHKVGKFGIGFNSVYHISGKSMHNAIKHVQKFHYAFSGSVIYHKVEPPSIALLHNMFSLLVTQYRKTIHLFVREKFF